VPISFGLRCTVVILTCFAMFDFVYVGVLQCFGVSVICVFAFTMFMLFVLCLMYCSFYVYLVLFVLSVLM